MSVPYKTIIHCLSAVLIFSIALALPKNTKAENQDGTKTVIVIGAEKIYKENVAIARKKAIENSLVSAVDRVAVELLSVESIIQNFQIYNEVLHGQTGNLIQGYKVMTEFPSENNYRVMIEATVSISSLKELISSAGIVLDKKALPRILFLISEKNFEDNLPKYWWGRNSDVTKTYSPEALLNAFKSNGFPIIDHTGMLQNTTIVGVKDKPNLNNREAVNLGISLEADVVVVGESISDRTPNIMEENTRSFKGVVSARAVRTDTGVEIASTLQSTVTTNTDEIAGSRDALFNAGTIAGRKLASQIVAAWQKEGQAPNMVEIMVEGTGNLANFVKFRRMISDMPGVNHLQMKEMTPNHATIIVDFIGSAEDLANALMLKTFETIGINIYEISQNHLKIELIPS